jgi:hypothetical protein
VIPGVERCPSCRAEVEQTGDTEWDDRGLNQLISTRRFAFECGQTWTNETDGG